MVHQTTALAGLLLGILGLMAPRKTQHGASATTRRTAGTRGSGASSSRRTASKEPKRASTSSKSAAKEPAARGKAKPSASTPKRKSTTKRPPEPRQWWFFPVTIALTVLVFGWAFYPAARVQYRETRERARLASELKSLQSRNDRLRDQVEQLKTPEGVEAYARSQLGLVKKGENAVVVVDGTSSQATTAAPDIDSDSNLGQPVGPWTAFLDLVFGVR